MLLEELEGELEGSFRVIGPDGEVKQEGKIITGSENDKEEILKFLKKMKKQLKDKKSEGGDG